MSLLKQLKNELKAAFVESADSIGETINNFAREAYNNPHQAFVRNPVQAARDFATAVDTISTEAYFSPKETLVDRPVAFIISTHNEITESAQKRLPSFVPRDGTTKAILGTGAAAYIGDIWDPFPIGESICLTAFTFAGIRGTYHAWRERLANTVNPLQRQSALEFTDLQ